jgi:ferredoxin
MRVSVDEDSCTGCGLCVDVCPELFEMEGDIARAKVSEVPEGQEDCAEEAAESCPVEAIDLD